MESYGIGEIFTSKPAGQDTEKGEGAGRREKQRRKRRNMRIR
jgi:hypothetical protein